MSCFVAQEAPKEVETVPAANDKWTLAMKISVAVLAFILYILLLMSAKTMYAKNQHLDRMDDSVLKTEEMMHNLHTIDRDLAIQLERIENMIYDEENEVTTEGYY